MVIEGEHNNKPTDFYGVVSDIIEIRFMKGCRTILLWCQWFDIENKKNGIHNDGYFTSINISRTWYHNEPFVLANQASQVFYMNDTRLGKNWQVVQKFQHRHIYDVPEKDDATS